MTGQPLQKTPVPLLRKIWALAKELKLKEEDVRVIAERITGEPRLSCLSKLDACLIIDAMNENSGNSSSRSQGRISKAQRWRIEQICIELGWNDEPERLRGFVKKYYKVDHLDWLTTQRASALIESLKKVSEKRKGSEA